MLFSSLFFNYRFNFQRLVTFPDFLENINNDSDKAVLHFPVLKILANNTSNSLYKQNTTLNASNFLLHHPVGSSGNV